ncbi:MAG: hypothetical protein Q9195_009618 [Heterodermia aff. obscurata]
MDTMLASFCAVAASLGICSHLLYFIHGEHHTQALRVLQLSLVLPVCSVVALVQFGRYSVFSAVQTTAWVALSYIGSLWTSMIVYRVFFHPLRHFPGPPLAKVSKLYHVACLRKPNNHRVKAGWHERYGDFVRIGPNELSVISPTAQTTILGPRSTCLKSGWYDYVKNQPLESLHAARDVDTHDARRRVWDRGFSIKALRDYEVRVLRYGNELVEGLTSLSGQRIIASDWFSYFSFDVMGDLAFGESFNMLKNGETHTAIQLLHHGMAPLAMLAPVVWVIPVLAALPSYLKPAVAKGFDTFIAWCAEQVERRRKMKLEIPDITSWLLTDLETSQQHPKEALKWLHGDARLIVVAGADTVAATLTPLFYHLAAEPTHIEKLRAEIATIWKEGTPFNVWDFQNAEYLNGVINEALRLHPAVPSGVQRITPPEGVTIDGVFVPGGVNIMVPSWAIGRSPKIYPSPLSFLPTLRRFRLSPAWALALPAIATFYLAATIGSALDHHRGRGVVWKSRAYRDAGA